MRILGPTKVELAGRVLTSFAGTNYLGLSFHPRILEALSVASHHSGFGMGASRKTTGTTDQLLELERGIATFTGAETAIVTTSGTLANIGVVEGLKGVIQHWLIDENAHSSFTSFLPLAGATIHPYRHLDVQDLRRQLSQLKGKVGIFTDAVFPLTGEIAPLLELAQAAGDALLVFDEAHALGVLGSQGCGLVGGKRLHSSRTLVTTTFTKALGCVGGAILGPEAILQHIREESAVLASTSALSPSLASAALTALDLFGQEPERLARLHQNLGKMRQYLGMPLLTLAAPIFSRSEQASELTKLALEAGFLVPLLSAYPGSPPGGALRWMVSSEHTDEEIRNVAAILTRL